MGTVSESAADVFRTSGDRDGAGRPVLWYGAQPAWQIDLERDAQRAHGLHLRREQGIGVSWRRSTGWLAYHHDGLNVPGRRDTVPVTVAFFEDPPYDTYGIAPENYPRIWADCGAVSPHRMSDQAPCLYYPWSAVEQRWTAADGLLPLLNLVRDHLYFEHYWRLTGGQRRGQWLGGEAAHGVPDVMAS
ncbi:hypothetical protein [Nocardioides sp. zg-1228]|uniref:hypothetical protein n=1 Tax=Nocardioides sp. zg-1228 TaxID=2763008 RepID=UPI001C9302B2|nr:hypothetical protein [Nocardioides sp. zg-1228]